MATTAVRALAVILVGIAVFTGDQGSRTQLTIKIGAFAVAVTAMGGWWATEGPTVGRHQRPRVLLAIVLLTTLACGFAATTRGGGPLIYLSLVVTIAAGSDLAPTVSWATVGVGALAAETGALTFGASAGTTLGYVLILVAGLVVGQNRRTYRVQAEQSTELLSRAGQLREEQSRTATLDERNRIAREIHDVLAHSLGALGVQVQAARAVLTDQHDERRAVELLDQAQRMATEGLRETRRAVYALRGDTPPFPEGLADLTAAHRLRHRTPVTLQVTGTARPLTPDARLALTRAAQEALVNTAKHAPHQPVEVWVGYADGHTLLAVANPLGDPGDRGEPQVESVNGGYGLAGLRERLLLIRGSLTAGPQDGRWVVTAQVPQ